jgi:hypothetical protein
MMSVVLMSRGTHADREIDSRSQRLSYFYSFPGALPEAKIDVRLRRGTDVGRYSHFCFVSVVLHR